MIDIMSGATLVRYRNFMKGKIMLETKTYPDGITATGTAPLPESSPVSDTDRLEKLNAHMQRLDARVWGDIFGPSAINTFHLREAIDRLY